MTEQKSSGTDHESSAADQDAEGAEQKKSKSEQDTLGAEGEVSETDRDSSEHNAHSELYWVGIGASAGGLEAVKALVSTLPKNANMVYIVAQHLSPKHKSMMTELVQRNTTLKVETVTNDCTAQPNTVYITPPQMDVRVEGNRILLSYAGEESIPKPSINALLVSLAEEKKERAIGIILSGTGSDGAHGIKNIRAMGGMTIAQDQKTAHYDGMPVAAMQTDCVDMVLSPEEIGQHLTRLSRQLPQGKRLKLEKAEVKDHFSELMNLIKTSCGVSFKDYKKATLQRRIERRMLACGFAEFEAYVEYAREHADEVHLLFKDVLISVTEFFRDKAQFESLAETVSRIVNRNDQQGPIRLWTVGCATGEEAYSLAILLAEALGGPEKLADRNFQIFATDVDTKALTVARRGIYDHSSMVNVPEQYVSKYFIRDKDSYEVIKPIKDIMLFASHNVIEDPPFLRMDMITCRNLLIYFEPDLQKKVYKIFHYALKPKAFMFLGKSESISQASQLFFPIDSKNKIFQKRAVSINAHAGLTFSGHSRYVNKVPGKKEAEKSSIPELHKSLVSQLGDASVLINDNFDIEHIYGDITPYVSLANGKPALNLADIINNVHRQEIRALAYKALREGKQVVGQPRKIKIHGELLQDRLRIFPLEDDHREDRYLLVVFEKIEQVDWHSSQAPEEADRDRVSELESELAAAREHLQTVIEELETSNEELQSLNEELQSSNEELQSSNEELETTNEELQSANEELVTMNDELNNKTVALEQASNQLVNIKNSLSFPLVVVDENNRIIKANSAARNKFEFVDDAFEVAKVAHNQDDQTIIDKIITEVWQDSEVRHAQLEDGDCYYWLHATPFFQRDQTLSGVILSFIDNTELVLQKQELEESRKKAQSANIAKTEFLANVSHEIRTPLNAIYGVTEILKIKLSEETKKSTHLQVLENSAVSLKELLDDLLDFAKLEAGKLSLETVSFSLRSLIDKVMDNYTLQASNKNIEFRSDIPQAMHDIFLGDPLRIQQVLANLVSNAIKFTSTGSVILSVRDLDHDKETIRIAVQDTGIGMEEAELEDIFEKFSQSDASISRRYGGTGLGLAIVRELVKLMNGDISVTSRRNEGSTFTIEIPLKHCDSYENRQQVDQDLQPLFDSTEQARSKKILVVDDNRSNVVVMASFLDQLGCAYDIAESGHEAIRLASEHDYRCVLLDIQMEGLDGFQTYEQLRAIEKRQAREQASVIAVSGNVQKSVIERTYEIGMVAFLKKPVELAKLRQQIAECIL